MCMRLHICASTFNLLYTLASNVHGYEHMSMFCILQTFCLSIFLFFSQSVGDGEVLQLKVSDGGYPAVKYHLVDL